MGLDGNSRLWHHKLSSHAFRVPRHLAIDVVALDARLNPLHDTGVADSAGAPNDFSRLRDAFRLQLAEDSRKRGRRGRPCAMVVFLEEPDE